MQLKIQCNQLLMDLYPNGIIERKKPLIKFQIDNISVQILKSATMMCNYTPISITGDGNCLFRSISKALYGVEDLHLEIRFRTLLKMIYEREELIRLSKCYLEESEIN